MRQSETDRQTVRQSERQTERDRERQRERDTEREREKREMGTERLSRERPVSSMTIICHGDCSLGSVKERGKERQRDMVEGDRGGVLLRTGSSYSDSPFFVHSYVPVNP